MVSMFWREKGIKPSDFQPVFAVEDFVNEVKDWAETYEIQKRVGCGDDFSPTEDLGNVSDSLIWTDQWSDGREDFLSPGFEVASPEIGSWGVQGWYVGLEPWDEDATPIASEIYIPCPYCFSGTDPEATLEENLQILNAIKPVDWQALGLSSGTILKGSRGCEFCQHTSLIHLFLSDFVAIGS